jgi:excinuclease ABC subunit B
VVGAAPRLRDEIRRLEQLELATADDPLARGSNNPSEARQGQAAAGNEKNSVVRRGDEPSPLEGEGGRPPTSAVADVGEQPGEVGNTRLRKGDRVRGSSQRVRKNSLDEMTIRRTEVPLGNRPHKPDLDHMGPGTDLEVPLSDSPRPAKPRSVGGRPGSEAGRRGRKR